MAAVLIAIVILLVVLIALAIKIDAETRKLERDLDALFAARGSGFGLTPAARTRLGVDRRGPNG